MADNRNRDRANLGEQADMSNTDVDREDRSMHGGAQGDGRSGSEGIEDPAMDRTQREAKESGSSDRNGRASSSDMARVTKRARRHRDSMDES